MTSLPKRLLPVMLLSGVLTGASAATTSSGAAVAAWFAHGRCQAFNAPYAHQAPFARNTDEQLQWMNRISVPFTPGA